MSTMFLENNLIQKSKNIYEFISTFIFIELIIIITCFIFIKAPVTY